MNKIKSYASRHLNQVTNDLLKTRYTMHQVSAFVTAISAVSYTQPRGAQWESRGIFRRCIAIHLGQVITWISF